MRQDLAALRAWLLEKGVTHVGTEGTGVYWQPVHAALEGDVTVIVGNASHMRNVPGRKTDVKDAEWIADLVRHGLVRASFVPPPDLRVLRDLVRHRKALVGTLAAERNRTLKLLGSAGIKLAGVMSSVFGVPGMLMLRALAEGSAAPAAMADLAKRRLRSKIDRLAGDGSAVLASGGSLRDGAGRAARRAPAPAAQDAYPALGGDRARPRRGGGGHRCRHASLRRPASLAGDHPRRGRADGRGHCRRNRRGHDRLWHRSASCCLGGVG